VSEPPNYLWCAIFEPMSRSAYGFCHGLCGAASARLTQGSTRI
jgi:hypothetical protein